MDNVTVSEQPSQGAEVISRVWESPAFRRVGAVVLAIALLVLGVVAGASLWASPQGARNVAPPASFSPALGNTDAVLSLQVISDDKPVYHRCVATLIKPALAVTAAHCVDTPPQEIENEHAEHCGKAKDESNEKKNGLDPSRDPAKMKFTVRGHTKKYNEAGETAGVRAIRLEPRWSWDNRGSGKPLHDVALLDLDRAMTTITPVTVAPNRPAVNAWTLVAGWGTPPSRCGDIQPTMEQWALRVTSCERNGQNPFEVCATTNGALGPCEGTSGGPLFSLSDDKTPTLIGVYSHAYGLDYCGQDEAVFTLLSAYPDFIPPSPVTQGPPS